MKKNKSLIKVVNQDFVIPELGAYGFQEDALSLIKSYSMKRQEQVRVNSKFNTWKK